MSADGVEIYKLIERLQALQAAEFAFRLRSEARRREFEEGERRMAEESHKLHAQLIATKKELREKLGVPEPAPVSADDVNKSGFSDVGDFFAKLNDVFDNLTQPCAPFPPAGPDGPPCG